VPWVVSYAWLIPFYGFSGAALTLPWIFGVFRRTGQRPAAYLNQLMTLVGLVHSTWLLLTMWGQPSVEVVVPWFQVFDLNLTFALDISQSGAIASVLVCGISLVAQIYGLGSMETDWSLGRFYALMGFFEGAIGGIALSDSLFLSYALLELLTLSTYLLVGFWYTQPLVVSAARDAFWTKRVGDLFLLMGVVALSTLSASLNFSDLGQWAATPETQAYFAAHPWYGTLLGLALIAGPVGKCAQFPLNLWLDEAMEGPNPASILRNSVVVGGGAYVLIKLQPVLALFPVVDSALVTLGTITALSASLVAIAQIDLKRALSHTTSAYLGLVFVAVGMGQSDLALEMLFTHAVAKSLMFMSVGAVMMTIYTQDLTEMGGLAAKMPVTTLAFGLASLSLTAMVPLGNFWTMAQMADAYALTAPLLVGVILAVNGLTSFGLVRVFSLVFAGKPQPKTRRAPEVGWVVALPLVSLVAVTLHVPLFFAAPPAQYWVLNGMLVGSGLIGSLTAGLIYLKQYDEGSTVPLPPRAVRPLWRSLQNLFADDLYVQKLYRVTIVALVAGGSRFMTWVDRYWVDGAVNSVGILSVLSSQGLKYTVTGRSQQYVLTILIGLLVVVLFASLG